MLYDSCCVIYAVARKDKASVEEMQAVVGIQLLEVLLILTRSQSNRQRLLALGLLRALATAMKVGPQASVYSGSSSGLLIVGVPGEGRRGNPSPLC